MSDKLGVYKRVSGQIDKNTKEEKYTVDIIRYYIFIYITKQYNNIHKSLLKQ